MHTAFYGSQELKDLTLAQVRRHRAADEIIQGTYFANGKGCHLGCLTHSNSGNHGELVELLAIPEEVSHLFEMVFEGLPANDCAQWVEDSTQSIASGADLSRCHHALAAWLLGDESPLAASNQHELVAYAVAWVRVLHQRAASGRFVSWREWRAAYLESRKALELSKAAARNYAMGNGGQYGQFGAAIRSAATAERSCGSCAAIAVVHDMPEAVPAIAAKSLEIFRDAPVVDGVQDGPELQASLATMRANAI